MVSQIDLVSYISENCVEFRDGFESTSVQAALPHSTTHDVVKVKEDMRKIWIKALLALCR